MPATSINYGPGGFDFGQLPNNQVFMGGGMNWIRDTPLQVPSSPTTQLPMSTTMPDLLQAQPVGAQQPINPTGVPDLFQPGLYPTSYSGTDANWANNIWSTASPIIQRLTSMMTPVAQNPTQLPTDMSAIMKNAAPGVLQSTMNNLAGRNMLNSSVASDSFSKALSGLGGTAMTLANQNAATNQAANNQVSLENLKSMMNMPIMLNSLLSNISGMGQLGQQSFYANPLAPYELLNNFLLNY